MEKLSRLIFGLDWTKHLPVTWGDFSLEVSNFEEFDELKRSTNSFLITNENGNAAFLRDKDAVHKDNYLKYASDFFTLRHREQVIGAIICDVMDWSTYYLRYIFIHQDYRSHNLTLKFVQEVEKVLRAYPFDKITCDISPAHLGQMTRMSQAGYITTGNILSERFGANLRLTKFLKEESWNVFNQNFISMFYQRTPKENV